MGLITNGIIGLALLAVTIVLILGILNMVRNRSANRSQMLMRWRVGLQFLAVLIIFIVVAIFGGQ